MNRLKKINKKLLFVAEFWGILQKCEVEAFDTIYPVDAIAILEDLRECINRIIQSEDKYLKDKHTSTKYLKTFDLKYLIKEYNFYLKNSVFLQTDLESYLINIRNIFDTNNNFNSYPFSNRMEAYSNFRIVINDINYCIAKQKANLNYFDIIVDKVIEKCMNSSSLKNELTKFKAYLTELYIFGIANRYSEDKLKMVFKLIKRNMRPYCNVKNIRYLNQKFEEMEYTCIFEVENMFVQSPIKWNDILIYNPMRVDLLKYVAREKFYYEDYKLLNFDKRELFDKYELLGNKILYTDEDYEEHILRTNSHIRVKVKTDDINFKIGKVRNDVEEKIQLLSFAHNITGFQYILSTKYAYKSDKENISYVHNIFDKNVNYTSHSLIRQIEDDIKKDINEPKSMINKVASLNEKDSIIKAFRWYDEARHEKNENKRFLYYFICIETILSNSAAHDSIKNKFVKIVTPMLSSRAFARELRDYFSYYGNEFSTFNNKYRGVPQRVRNIEGFEKFPVKVSAKKFKDGLSKLLQYTDSIYYSTNICEYIKMNNSEKYRRKIVNRYEAKIHFILSRIYRNRNKIVHAGQNNHYQIQLYCTYLAFASSVLLQSIIEDINVNDITEDIENKLLDTTISSKYNIWFNDFI